MNHNVKGYQVFIIKLMNLGFKMVWGMTTANNSSYRMKDEKAIIAHV